MDLLNFAIKDVPGIEFSLTTNQEYDLEFERLKVRHRKPKTIPGTQRNHQFIPVSDISIQMKVFSYFEKKLVKDVWFKLFTLKYFFLCSFFIKFVISEKKCLLLIG